jgi:hypothetical protein
MGSTYPSPPLSPHLPLPSSHRFSPASPGTPPSLFSSGDPRSARGQAAAADPGGGAKARGEEARARILLRTIPPFPAPAEQLELPAVARRSERAGGGRRREGADILSTTGGGDAGAEAARCRGGRDHGGISSWGRCPHLRLPHTHPCRRGDDAGANSLICAARTSSRPAGGTTEAELLLAR